MEENGTKQSPFEAYYTQMLPLLKTSEAFETNTKDGFCFKVRRDGSDPFNLCFETKKVRDIIMMTTYNNYMLYKIMENGYNLGTALTCDDVMT